MAAPRVVSTLPWHSGVRVIQMVERLGILALSKPFNVLSHPNEHKPSAEALLRLPYDHDSESFELPEGSKHKRLYLLHRLDKSTSGVLLMATDSSSAMQIKALFQRRKMHKEYVALVFGKFSGATSIAAGNHEAWMWQDPLPLSIANGNAVAKTEARLLHYCPQHDVSMLKLTPKTGYKHQLRLQCAFRGLHIIGDDIHGMFAQNKSFFQANKSVRRRMYLHAQSISYFEEPDHNNGNQIRRVRFQSPLPAEFDWLKTGHLVRQEQMQGQVQQMQRQM